MAAALSHLSFGVTCPNRACARTVRAAPKPHSFSPLGRISHGTSSPRTRLGHKVTLSAGATVEEADTKAHASPVDWEAHWWPVLPVCCLSKERPQGIMILGTHLVVWWDKAASEWRVWDDACPHRLAPLSEGRLMDDGTLQCSYHGRTFEGCGKCAAIPQAAVDFPRTPRLDALVYPVREVAGLLFAWMQPGAEAAAAAAPPPVISREVAETDGLDWGCSDVPNDFQFWVEQAMDPTHAPYLHHMKNSNGAGGVMDMEEAIEFKADVLAPSGITGAGFAWAHGGYSVLNDGMQATRTFVAPNCVSVTYKLAGGGEPRVQHVFTVPVHPGKARIFYRFHAPPKTLLGKAARALENAVLPAAVRHSLSLARRDDHAIADEDVIIMHKEEAIMRASGRTKDAYMANLPADRGVMAAHRWLDLAGYAAMWARRMPNPPPWQEKSLAGLLDRWQRHVGQCAMCQQTMVWGQQLTKALYVMAGVAAAVAVGQAARAAASQAAGAAAFAPAAAVAGVAVLAALGALRTRRFVVGQFVSGVPRYARDGGLSLVRNKPVGPLLL